MSRRVEAVAGVRGLALPGGWQLDGGDTVVIPDSEWAQIREDVETLGRLLDLGSTTDLPDPVPTWRDIQRTTSGSSSGLEAEVDALSAAFGAHEAATASVHGITNTALLETLAGAQAKADTAEADAKAYTDAHEADTTDVHGIGDTSLLQYNAVFGFAAPSTLWTITHNKNTKALNVETFNDSGDRMLGQVEYPDFDTITISWYYATSGSARVFS